MVKLLDSIDGPEDLRGLSLAQLKELAQEIREELIATVSNNGGHLASNLGVVELTIALHRVFDSPRDKLIWDVGHQSYSHKLLTGRRSAFSTIRQVGGLSGFPEPQESPHDAFATGHASTSVSAALGMALARDLAGDSYDVVAIIGDGALTGGMAYEALNHAGHLGTKLIVVLNDNALAISPTVGALARFLARLRLSLGYSRTKRGAQRLFAYLPGGLQVWKIARGAKESAKRLLLPTVFWEEMGFSYLGPFDGHDIAQLESVLKRARRLSRKPVLLHVVTVKGKGHKPAETDAVKFHGLAPRTESKVVPTYSEVFARTTLRLFREEPRLVAITAAMLEGTGLSLVAREFPRRVFDVGISEQHAVTLAAGLATRGFVPIVAIYSTFLQRAYDQIIHDVCLQNLPVVFAIDRAGLVGDDGKTHQGSFDLSYLGCIPNLVLAAPADENELRHLLYTAVRARCPFAIRYPRGQGLGLPLEETLRELPVGRGELRRQGEALTIVALGNTVAQAEAASSLLAAEGIGCAVVNARFARPLDEDLILSQVLKTGRVLTVEENVQAGGFGSAVAALLRRAGYGDVRIECLGLPEQFIEHGPQELFRARYSLDAQGIARKALSAFPELKKQAIAPS